MSNKNVICLTDRHIRETGSGALYSAGRSSGCLAGNPTPAKDLIGQPYKATARTVLDSGR